MFTVVLYILYQKLGGCMKVVYIMPTIERDMSKLLGVFGPFGPRVDRFVVCKLVFTLVLYILCQQLGGCM